MLRFSNCGRKKILSILEEAVKVISLGGQHEEKAVGCDSIGPVPGLSGPQRRREVL